MNKENFFTMLENRIADRKLCSEIYEDNPNVKFKNSVELEEKINELIFKLSTTENDLLELEEKRQLVVDDLAYLENRKYLTHIELDLIVENIEQENMNHYNINSLFYLFFNNCQAMFKKATIPQIEEAGLISNELYRRIELNPQLNNPIIKMLLFHFYYYANNRRAEIERRKNKNSGNNAVGEKNLPHPLKPNYNKSIEPEVGK